MQHVYACHLRFEGDPAECLPRARALTRLHVAEPYGRWPDDRPPNRDGMWHPRPTTSIRWRNLDDPEAGRLWEVSVEHAHRRDPSVRWAVLYQVGADADAAFAYVRRSLRSTTGVVTAPGSAEALPPGVVASLVHHLPVLDAGRRLTAGPWTAVRRDAGALATLLTHPGRQLPVVAVSHTEGGDGLDPERLAARLAGLAHVVFLAPPAAAELAGLVGEDVVPAGGEVRLWWPGWLPGETGGTHRWHLWELRPGQTGLEWPVLAELYATAALRLDVPPLARRLEAAAARRRIAEIEAKAASSERTDVQMLESWEADLVALEEARLEAAVATDELERVRTELRELTVSFSARLGDAVERARSEAAAPPPAGAPTTMAQAIARAAAECRHLVFLPEAHQSAARSPFVRPHDVYADLRRLDEVAARWQRDEIGAGFTAACLEAGLPWVSDISTTAKTMFRADYERTYEGRRILLGPHLRYAANVPPDRHCRVYCHLDRERRVVVVGHAGVHLRDAGNR